MPIRRVLQPFVLLFGLMLVFTLSPSAQPEDGSTVLAVSAYDLANDRSQILLLSLAEDGAVSLLHEVLLPLDSGIVAYNYGLSLSPGARQIVYPAIMAEGPDQLFIYDVESGHNTRLIDDPENAYGSPVFSPDGTKIAFTLTGTDEEGVEGTDIYVANADGTESARLTESPDIAEDRLAWSSDGASLAYTIAQESGFQVLTIPAEGGEPDAVHDSELPLSTVAWSPDAERLFFAAQTPDELGTAISSVSLNGDDLRVEYDPAASSDFTPGIDWLTFSPDDTRLAFAASELVQSATGTMVNRATLRLLSLDTGETDILPWDFGTAFITGLDWRAPSIAD
jgi:Tol biopolymer transport system component